MLCPLRRLTPLTHHSVTLGLSYSPSHPDDYALHPWPGFAVTMATNLFSLLVVLLQRDIIWAIAATWICISIWTASPKPAPVFVRFNLFLELMDHRD